jgi:hypothetical protein
LLQCDLIDNREVSNVEGRDLAKSFGVPFFESSAKSRINVEEAFYELVRGLFLFGGPPFFSIMPPTPFHAGPRNPASKRCEAIWPCRCCSQKRQEKKRLQPPLGLPTF